MPILIYYRGVQTRTHQGLQAHRATPVFPSEATQVQEGIGADRVHPHLQHEEIHQAADTPLLARVRQR